MNKPRVATLGIFGLGVGYFLWYVPYAALAKAVSSGLLPGVDQPVGGLVLLPAHALGMLLAMPIFVLCSRWWRYSHRRTVAGRRIPFPVRHTAESAFWMSLIVMTTTLNFTFPGASIVFMLVLMRIGRLIIAPSWDLVRRWRIQWYSAVALGMCAVSAFIALADIDNYALTAGAVLSLCVYWLGYINRFRIMSRHAKTGDRNNDRQYFIEEHMATPIVMLLLLAIPALVDVGPWMHALRIGFTSFLTTPLLLPALLIGVCYEGLFIMTTLIYLDRREFSFGMPVSVAASLLAGIVAAIGLSDIYGAPVPSAAQYVSAAAVICAAFVLSLPTIRAVWAVWAARAGTRATGAASRNRPETAPALPGTARGPQPRVCAPRSLLFVCGGNTSRSPMAAAIARAELAAAALTDGGSARWRVGSAGVAVRIPGAPISPQAVTALLELGVEPAREHRARALTPAMCAGTDIVYTMTRAQRDSVVALAPDAAARTVCLDPAADLPDPSGQPAEAYRACATRLRDLVRRRVGELREQP